MTGNCVFINLDSATDRRRSVEASFARARPAGWSLTRFAARTPDHPATPAGSTTPAERACFASHRDALVSQLDIPGPTMIVEDDTVFSTGAFEGINDILAAAPQWDVVFTDVGFIDMNLMTWLAHERPALMAAGGCRVVNLKPHRWFAAAAYVITEPAKAKLADILTNIDTVDLPYDLVLERLANEGHMTMGACFPFLTTLAEHGDRSQIQSTEHLNFDLVRNAYRRLMFIERDMDACRAEGERLKAQTAEDAQLFGGLFAAMSTPGVYPIDR